jgi:hypothetical protein
MGSAGSKATQRAKKLKDSLEQETRAWISEQRRLIDAGLTDPDYSDIYVLWPGEFIEHRSIDAGNLEPIGKRGPKGVYTWPAPKEGTLLPLAEIWDVTQSVVTGESGKAIELKLVLELTDEDDHEEIRKSVNWATLTNRIVRGLNERANGVSRFEKWRSTLEQDQRMYKMYMAYFDTPESTAVAMVGHIKRIFLAAVLLVQQHSHEHSNEHSNEHSHEHSHEHSRERSQVPLAYANRLSIGG